MTIDDNPNTDSGAARSPDMTGQGDLEAQLHQAAANGDTDIVQKLLSDHQNLNINATDDDRGQTALEIACVTGQPTLVECLVGTGADLHHIDKDGLSAVHHACGLKDQNASLKIVQTLFDEDPTVINKQSLNDSRDTCLHIAAKKCNTGLIRWLLDAGVDTSVENETWRTAWDCSQEEVFNRAFFSTPVEMNRSLDSYSAFIEKEVTSGNARETIFDISMRTVKNLEVYRLLDVHVNISPHPESKTYTDKERQTLDIFVGSPNHGSLPDSITDQLVFRSSWSFSLKEMF